MLVYLLRNKINGKQYVGKTVEDNLDRYLSTKRWQASHGNPSKMPIVAAIAKYGWENFESFVLARTSDFKILGDIEKVWIIATRRSV